MKLWQRLVGTFSHTATTPTASCVVEPKDAVLNKLRERIVKLRKEDVKPEERRVVDEMVAFTERQVKLVPLAFDAFRMVKSSYAIRFSDVKPLVYNLQELLMHQDRQLTLEDALTRVTQGMDLKCPNCGQLTHRVVTYLLAFSGNNTEFSGSGALQFARLARGQCPICCEERVTVTVDRAKMIDRRPRIQDHMKYIRSVDYKDRPETRDWQIIDGLKDVPRLANTGQVAEASECLRKSLDRYDDFDFVYSWTGILFERQGKVDEARDAYMKGLRSSRKKHHLCEKMGDLELKHGSVEDAIMWFVLSAVGQLNSKQIQGEGAWLYLAHTAKIIDDNESSYVFHSAQRQGQGYKRSGGLDLSGEAREELSQRLSSANEAVIRELISEASRLTRELGPGV